MRKTYIDIAKGIGILLVILGHMNRFFSYEGRLNQIVYSVQLPVFLIIGGYWMRLKAGESPLAFAAGKFYRLMQPYFLFAFSPSSMHGQRMQGNSATMWRERCGGLASAITCPIFPSGF